MSLSQRGVGGDDVRKSAWLQSAKQHVMKHSQVQDGKVPGEAENHAPSFHDSTDDEMSHRNGR